MAINLFLDGQLADTGGLSGIGLRSSLETLQAVLRSAIQIVLPFWNLGLFYSALAISRGQAATADHLFEGFRRWGAALRLMLFRTLRYSLGSLCGLFLGTLLFSFTPFSNKLFAASELIAMDPSYTGATAEELMAALASRVGVWDIVPYYIFCVLGVAVVLIPMFFRYRLSDYVLLDSEKPGALLAIHKSTYMMHGNAKRLFAIDLKLWWYYLLTLLSAAVSFGDLLLPIFGISLPFSATWALVIFSTLSSAMQFAIFYLFCGQVETVYACFYESLKESEGGNEEV